MAERVELPAAWQQTGDHTGALMTTLLIIDSLHFVWARMLLPHLPPTAAATFVLAIGAAQITVFNLINKRARLHWQGFRRHAGFYLSVGLLVAVSTSMNYAAIAFIDPGMASLLGKTGILFGIALSIIWLRDRLNRQKTFGALIAVTGVFVIGFHSGGNSPLSLGALLVLGSAFLYALHTAIVKRFGDDINFAEFFMHRLLTTTGALLALTLLSGEWSWPHPGIWLLLLIVGSVDVVISRALYYAALRRLNMSTHTVILTLSPVIAVFWSMLLFNTWPTLQELIGGLAVLAGIAIVSTSRTQA
jgi:drug/metabolite transporter (DMT)-like permease